MVKKKKKGRYLKQRPKDGNSASNTQKLFARLYISALDLNYASSFAEYILKKGLHLSPWERRWPTNVMQSAFTSSLITFYARPFTKSYGLPNVPIDLLRYGKREKALHQEVLGLRHQVYAHSDGNRYSIEPVRIFGRTSAIVGAPYFKLEKSQVECLRRMIRKAKNAIDHQLESLMNQIEREEGSKSLSPEEVLAKMNLGSTVKIADKMGS